MFKIRWLLCITNAKLTFNYQHKLYHMMINIWWNIFALCEKWGTIRSDLRSSPSVMQPPGSTQMQQLHEATTATLHDSRMASDGYRNFKKAAVSHNTTENTAWDNRNMGHKIHLKKLKHFYSPKVHNKCIHITWVSNKICTWLCFALFCLD